MAKILIAEDDSAMRTFIARVLQGAGHDVTASGNGLDALAEAKEKQDFDLLLADIVMPGMDGIELTRQATKACPELKVMYITGFAAVAAAQTQTAAQNADRKEPVPRLLSKPFHLKDLVREVEDLLAEPAAPTPRGA